MARRREKWHITYEVFRDLGVAFAAVLALTSFCDLIMDGIWARRELQ